jgi:hypothetical protein
MDLNVLLRLVIGAVYLCCGAALLMSRELFNLTPLQRTLFGTALILYGGFRLYRGIKLKKQNEEEPDQDDQTE